MLGRIFNTDKQVFAAVADIPSWEWTDFLEFSAIYYFQEAPILFF